MEESSVFIFIALTTLLSHSSSGSPDCKQLKEMKCDQQNVCYRETPVAVITNSGGIPKMAHADWRGEESLLLEGREKDMFRSFSNNAYSVKATVESFMWHFANIMLTGRTLSDHIGDYLVIFRIHAGFSIATGRDFSEQEITQIKKEFRVILVNGCRHVIKAINPENLIHSLHIKAFRGLIWGNVQIINLIKEDVQLINSITRWTMNIPSPSYTEFRIRLSFFLTGLRIHEANMRTTQRYWCIVMDLTKDFYFKTRRMTRARETAHIRKTHGSRFFLIKEKASIELIRAANSDRHYEAQYNTKKSFTQFCCDYAVVFKTLAEYPDAVMFLIDTEAMKKILTNLYIKVPINTLRFKNDTVNCLEKLISTLNRDQMRTYEDVQSYMDRLRNLCTQPFCRPDSVGYPSYWMKTLLVIEVMHLTKIIVNILPRLIIRRSHVRRNIEIYKAILEQCPLPTCAYLNSVSQTIFDLDRSIRLQAIREEIRRRSMADDTDQQQQQQPAENGEN